MKERGYIKKVEGRTMAVITSGRIMEQGKTATEPIRAMKSPVAHGCSES